MRQVQVEVEVKKSKSKKQFAEDFDLPDVLKLARDYFIKKGVLTKLEFIRLSAEARWQSFTVARVNDTGILEKIKTKLDAALESGIKIEDFTADMDKVFDAAGLTKLNPFHLDTVFLTNAMTGYGEGRKQVIDNLSVDEFPYRQISTVGDSRVRDPHKILDDFVAAKDDAVWTWLKTPFSYRCRCIISPVHVSEGLTPSVMPKVDWGKGFEFITPGSYGSAGGENWQDAKTIAEAEKWAKDKDIKYVNYQGLDVKVANDMNRITGEYLSKYPRLKREINYLGTNQNFNKLEYELSLKEYISSLMKKGATRAQAEKYAKTVIEIEGVPKNLWAQAVWGGEVNGIMINKTFGKNRTSFNAIIKKSDGKNGWHPKGCETVDSVIHHELGHKLFDIVGGSKYYQKIANIFSSTDYAKIEKGLSKYATENIDEFVAEAWAEFKSSPTPRAIAKKVGNLIEKALAENP